MHMQKRRQVKYLITMAATFVVSLILVAWSIFCPLDSVRSRGGYKGSRVDALNTKIFGMCVGATVLSFAAIKIIQLYGSITSRKIGAEKMRIFVAIMSAAFMLAMTFFLTTLLFVLIWPYSRTEVSIGALTTNIAGVLGLIMGSLASAHTFKASLKSKTGKLYKRNKDEGARNT
jgi:hypothetical protein